MTLEQILNTEISLKQITHLISSVHPVIWIGIYVVFVFCKTPQMLRQKNLDTFEFYAGWLLSPLWLPLYLIYKILENPVKKLNYFLDPEGIKLRDDIRAGKKICYRCKKFHRTADERRNLPNGKKSTDCELTF